MPPGILAQSSTEIMAERKTMTKKYHFQAFNGQTVELERGVDRIKIEAIGSDVFHIYSEKAADFPSYAVEKKPLPVALTEKTKGGRRCYYTDSIGISIEEDGLDFVDPKGKPICRTFRGEAKRPERLAPDFLELLVSEGHTVMVQPEPAEAEMSFWLEPKDRIYGLGDKTGGLNKRCYEYEMWNTDDPTPHEDNFKALYKSIPFLMVLKEDMAYGLFFDNHHKSYFDLGKWQSNCLHYEAEGGALDFYFFAGRDLKAVLTAYTGLTGRTPLPQLWTLGYHQSRWGYRTEQEMRELAANLRRCDLPCDAIHFDIDYMDGYRVFTWNRERYENAEKALADLKEMGIKAITIVDPGVKVDAGYAVYDEGLDKAYFAKDKNNLTYVNQVWPGDSVYPDFGRAEVRLWWGDLHRFLVDKGVAGIWNDMNEPASFNGPLPDDVVFYDEDKPSTHKAMHNVYGHNMTKATFEGLRRLTGERPFVITRACYAGSQKYAVVWTGDNHSLWSHLRLAIPQLCNLGMSGFPFSGTDVGGFGSDTTPELLIRWFQLGCFSPLFRNHSALATLEQEPWCFGEDVLAVLRRYIHLRYQLLPYFYDCFYRAAGDGLPVMRPLVLNYPFDPEVQEKNDQFMIGDALLVAPVVEQGAAKKLVYLPEGEWFDYWTKQKYSGQAYYIIDAPLSVCPLFVKSGTILPHYPVYPSVSERKDERLLLEVFGTEAEYVHYQDNGRDYGYEKGEYNLYRFTWQDGRLQTEMLHRGYREYGEIQGKG